MTRTATTLENVITTVDDVPHSPFKIYYDEEYNDIMEYQAAKQAALEFEEYFEA